MQTRLSIKQYDVAVYDVSLDNVADGQILRHRFTVTKFQELCLASVAAHLEANTASRTFLFSPLATKFAPGCTSGPFSTAFFKPSILCTVTLSGYVKIFATLSGTATSSILRFGSGEMTVRPEKSTRFPDKFPRKRPCLPFRRWTKPRMGRWPGWEGTPGSSELMYMATES